MENQTDKRAKRHLMMQVLILTCFRLILNTARRFAYPFAPVLSRGLQVPLTAVTSLIAVNQFTGFFGLLSGPLADRCGYRRVMVAGFGFMGMGMLVAAVLPVYGAVMLGFFLAGLGKSVFDPAVLSFASEQVPFHQRGRVIGFLEIAWAGSALVGIPLVSLLIDLKGWRAPFWALGFFGFLGMVVIAWLIPADSCSGASRSRFRSHFAWKQILQQPTTLGAMGFFFWVSLGNDNLFVIYGAWLESAFDIAIIAIGISTGAIGAAELIGEGLTATISDRIGLKRATAWGIILTVISYVFLPLLGSSLLLALTGLFTVFLTFEFTIVCSISLCTELTATMRATMLATLYTAGGLGRVIGALVGGPLWLWGGMAAVSAVSAITSILGLVCLMWGLRHSRKV